MAPTTRRPRLCEPLLFLLAKLLRQRRCSRLKLIMTPATSGKVLSETLIQNFPFKFSLSDSRPDLPQSAPDNEEVAINFEGTQVASKYEVGSLLGRCDERFMFAVLSRA